MKKEWNEKYKWCFSPLGTGDKVGVNNAGIGIFKKQKYIGLAKEILQNVVDASDSNVSGPVRACFEVIQVPRAEIPGAHRLSDVIKRCYEYYHEGDDGVKMSLLKKAAEKFLDMDGMVPVLKISDYNTVGLTGTRQEKGSNWTGLVREISATNKGNGKSGSFGVGKFAPFNFSALRTIVYSTYNKDNERALQGKTILTTFMDGDGKLKQNVGLFGMAGEDDCKAVYDMEDIPEIFHRAEYGTDLFVLGFEKDQDWMQQMAVSVLEYFFYTIFKGNLEVSIVDGEESIDINQDNLSQLIKEYEEYCKRHELEFSAPIFWELLHDASGKTKHFVETFIKRGNVELYLKVDPDFSERRILQMRAAGMKIREDTAFRIGAYFYGIFIATGEDSKSDDPKDNINSFLRKCENQAHDTWSKDEYEDNREEAGKVLKGIHKWILEKIKEQRPKEESEEIEAFGLSDLLPSQEKEGSEGEEERAYAFFQPKPMSIEQVRKNKNTLGTSDAVIVPRKPNPRKTRSIVVPGDGEDESAGGRTGRKQNAHQFHTFEASPGPEPSEHPLPYPEGPERIHGRTQRSIAEAIGKKDLKDVGLTGIKTPYDKENRTFRISFIPSKTAKELYVYLKIGSDDGTSTDAEVKSAVYMGKNMELRDGFIKIPRVIKGKRVVCTVELNNVERCPLEVAAYVE